MNVFGIELDELELEGDEFVTGVYVLVKVASGETAFFTRHAGIEPAEALGMLTLEAHRIKSDAYAAFEEDD